jgi:CRISPR/Cas system-associated exonuclease Cas4 (RecB family)
MPTGGGLMNEQGLSMEYLFNQHISRDDEFSHDSFHISGMGLCRRKRLLERTGASHVDVDLRTKRLFAIGKLHHIYFQDILEDAGILEEAEIKVEAPEVGFVGSCDALVKYDNEYYVYEFKNCHSRKIIYGVTDHHHVLQGLTYLMLIEKKLNIKIKELRLVLISRDDLLVKETGHTLTKELAEEISNEMFDMAQRLIKYEQTKELPDELANDDVTNWQCSYCGFIEHCPKAQERIKLPKVKKTKKEVANVNPTEKKDGIRASKV